MKILQINTTVNSGSTGRIAEDIGSVLIVNGHESYIAFGRGDNESQSKKIKIGTNKDVNWHGILTLLIDRHGFGSINATKELIKNIDAIKPDVIGLHNIHGYYINIEILFNYIENNNIPVIWTLHDCWSFTGHCTYFDSVGCEKWKTQCEKCPKTKMYPQSIGLDNSFKNFNDKKRIFNQVQNLQIVTPSNWLKNLVSESFLTHPVTCIHNGVDLDHFSPVSDDHYLIDRYHIKDKNVILGVASIWDKRKGLDDFIQLHSQLSEDFKIVLIGLSKTQLSNLPDGMLGITRTENVQELAEWYSLADVFVNPTYQDNFPTTNLEALACGTPVITYDTGGSPEAIDLETGEIVKKGDIQSLRQVIEKWCTNNSVETSKKCRLRAEKYFNKEDRYKEYLGLYEQVSRQKLLNDN
ncbi:MAG: glycosyltransferase [Algoriphagus sp.]|uniref:glycosyltransferase n=1 Tax=Algoriphagus sp. TaxID=1872435 RepID=UPI00260D282C|nr:glycosyltransferase [Algoriphagus sp.]MDG1279209.1 glycosyltransferase [Algoriphagus sp.]